MPGVLLKRLSEPYLFATATVSPFIQPSYQAFNTDVIVDKNRVRADQIHASDIDTFQLFSVHLDKFWKCCRTKFILKDKLTPLATSEN